MSNSSYRAYSPEVVRTIEMAQSVGWKYLGPNGGGHPRLQHKSGPMVDISGTTTNFRTIENDRHRLWRVSGAPESNKKSGKYRKGTRGSGFSLDLAVREGRRNADLPDSYCAGALSVAEARRAFLLPDMQRRLSELESELDRAHRVATDSAAALDGLRSELQGARSEYDQMALTWKVRDAERVAEGALKEWLRVRAAVDDLRAEIGLYARD